MKKRFQIFLCVCIASSAYADNGQLAWLESQIQKDLKINYSGTRTHAEVALAALVLNGDAATAQAQIQKVFDLQFMTSPSDSAYGQFPWLLTDPYDKILDANAVDFTMRPLIPILTHYKSKFSASTLAAWKPHIEAGLVAMENQKVPVSYTNIFLMKTMNLIVLGEAIGDTVATQLGYSQLDQWLAYTQQYGIHEYDSTNYYAYDLQSFLMGYLYAAQPSARTKCQNALNFLWADIAVNYFSGRQVLSGPHSRDYDWLEGTGNLDVPMYLEGLRTALPELKPDSDVVPDAAFFIENTVNPAAYHPANSLLTLTQTYPRTILSEWKEVPPVATDVSNLGRNRYNYMTSDFVMGSVSEDYEQYDKNIAIDLASSKSLPGIFIVPDTYDQPYGIVKTTAAEPKPFHLPYSPVSVQSQGTGLFLLAPNPASAPEAFTSLGTNVILPDMADSLYVDGTKITPNTIFTSVATSKTVVGIREGNSCVAARLFDANGLNGATPLYQVKADSTSLALNSGLTPAARLVVYHYHSNIVVNPKTITPQQVYAGLLISAQHCSTDADLITLENTLTSANITESFPTNGWMVSAQIGGLTLAATRNYSTKQFSRIINGQPWDPTDILSDNGTDLTGLLSGNGGTIQPVGTLPTPDLSNLNGGTFPVNGQLSITYNAIATGFKWSLIPINLSLNRSLSSQALAQPSVTEFSTPAPELGLSTLGLSIGTYSLSVQAVDGNQTSAPGVATISLISGDLNNVRVYPNPWRKDKDSGHSITFDQMASGSDVKIFTISGHKVKELSGTNGSATWDLTTDSGDRVASGIYIYLIKDSSGNKAKGKVAVIQ